MGWDRLMETLKKSVLKEQGTPGDGSKLVNWAAPRPLAPAQVQPQGIHIDPGKSRNKVR
jgi:uncharacterized protein with von Willebrand factor type A (vWA) domain